jgi:hypothetical protein
MPKRFNDKQRSIFVKFNHEATEKKVLAELKSMGVSGSRVSALINRWVIEVPFWKEEEYVDRLAACEIVEAIHENFDMRRRQYRPDEQEEV